MAFGIFSGTAVRIQTADFVFVVGANSLCQYETREQMKSEGVLG
jgi:hypothetical protein